MQRRRGRSRRLLPVRQLPEQCIWRAARRFLSFDRPAADRSRGCCAVASDMRISVIVATYNRATLLDDCLTHLARQRFEPGDEVVVVDNGSTDRTATVIRAHQQTLPVPLQWLAEPRPGKSHALGRAIAVATGDVLAFTDDDVNVDATW